MAWSSTVIPIHAPREGCDPGGRACTGLLTDFNPRTPRGVRRPGAGRLHHQMPISIHAPREGCDGIGVPAGHDPLLHFNPRTPRGVRHGTKRPPPPDLDFNPRTPRGVRRVSCNLVCRTKKDFNPRTPRGVRRSAAR